MKYFLPRVAFWLLPEETERSKFQKQIDLLADRFATVSFLPHVTIYSCYRSPQQSELILMTSLAKGFTEITLSVKGLSGAERLTEALTVKFEQSKSLYRLYQQFHAGVELPSTYQLNPHMSLLYRQIDAAVRNGLIEELTLSIENVRFNEIRAVAIPEKIQSPQDLIGWQTLLSCPLASCANVDTI